MVRRKSPFDAPLKLLGYAMLTAFALMMVVPFLWMISTSLKPLGSEFTFPPQILPRSLDVTSYIKLFTQAPFGQYFLNTSIVTAATVLGQLVICSMAAYAFARLTFLGRDTLFMFYLATQMVPFQVILIPLYLIIFKLGWVNTFWGLIAPGLSSAYGIFLLRQSFLAVPRDLIDAARVDGANDWKVYWRIFLPMNTPALATIGVFAFMGTWTDLLWPLLIARSENLRTLELGLAYFNNTSSAFLQPNWPLVMAASVVVMLPVLVVYFFAQRYFVEGIALGGVKG